MEIGKIVVDNDFETKSKSRIKTFQFKINLILSILVFGSILLYLFERKNKNETYKLNNTYKDKYIPLQSWNNCTSKTKLLEFINNISEIPIEARIAVFDFDGTLFQETDPVYNDWKIYQYKGIK